MTERGHGEKITIKKTIEDESVEYIQKNHSVRYQSGIQSIYSDDSDEPTTKPEYSIISFSQWARSKCATIAVKALNDRLAEKFDESLVGVSGAVDHRKKEKKVYISYSITRNQDGEVVEAPEVSFENIVSESPSHIAVTISLSGNKHMENFEISVKESTKFQQ